MLILSTTDVLEISTIQTSTYNRGRSDWPGETVALCYLNFDRTGAGPDERCAVHPQALYGYRQKSKVVTLTFE